MTGLEQLIRVRYSSVGNYHVYTCTATSFFYTKQQLMDFNNPYDTE
ncbi:hypothetical protein HMPREF0766_12333 [Sphingobacterium spiritivorum ATCC 33861]|uniref:Uncharacterized protein n=1 Tax=Sphingobacterium spiritivorum ATCC 33861 TaxID=525373 RepID=D7VMW3_SPHSI|nr:hypothetical protein HMPREF0766_12333 [Sphingobacterium spiritivorum ATCC 33861]